MGALAEFDKALVRSVRQLGEIGFGHRAWKIGVPFRVDEERWDRNLSWIIERLACAPIVGEFSRYAAGCTKPGRVHFTANGVGGERRIPPAVEDPWGNQRRLFVLRNA